MLFARAEHYYGKRIIQLIYINLEKVYELRMIRNNFIQENRVLENRVETNSHDSVNVRDYPLELRALFHLILV